MDKKTGIGGAAAFGAFAMWGFFPIYWKLLSAFKPEAILSFRILYAALFLILLGAFNKQLGTIMRKLSDKRVFALVAASAVLITINWFVYIWAVNHAFIVESSLGYFINPLVSVALGVIFLKEKITPVLGVSVLFALSGVAVMTAGYGRIPWIALILAFSFGAYGLTKKLAGLDGTTGLTLETGLLLVPTALFLGFSAATSGLTVRQPGLPIILLSLFAGIITAIPLILFGFASQRLSLSALGFIQYISPTLQLLVGVLIYGESFTPRHLLAFSLIWIAILIYSVPQLMGLRKAMRPQLPLTSMDLEAPTASQPSPLSRDS